MPNPNARFITHAITGELRDEFLSDIHRRLASLDTQASFTKQATEAGKIGRAKQELEAVLAFWQEVELRGGRREKAKELQA